jgi:hypothetical protein
MPEKWAGIWKFIENTLILKKPNLVRIDSNNCFFVCIFIIYQKSIVAALCLDYMNKA